MFYVYVIWNSKNQRTYVGQTQNIEKRLAEHNDPTNYSSRFTKRFDGRWQLLHSEEFETRSLALRREKELKTGKGRDFIKTLLPN